MDASDRYAPEDMNADPRQRADDLVEHRALIDACLRFHIPFHWHGPGALLIPSESIAVILKDVEARGFRVLGIDGFELNPAIHPRLDLIIDNTAGHPYRDPTTEGLAWGQPVWIDVTLALETG
jgi:hypothetical protein